MIKNKKIYEDDLINNIKCSSINWELLKDKSIAITGANGLIGSYIVDLIMQANKALNCNIKVIGIGRNKRIAQSRFSSYLQDEKFDYIEQDVINPIEFEKKVDFIIHAASNANPKMFALDPVGTMLGNFLGMKNVLEYARAKNIERVMYVSSAEIYGQPLEEMKEFSENTRGYIDNIKVRACYPISKQAAETLCSAYKDQYNVNVVIARPCHTYGPTATESDTRAATQFIYNIVNNEDIIMKSEGKQLRSYCYVGDCASGMLTILTNGKKGEVYNIANKNSNITIREFAEKVATIGKQKIIFEDATVLEQKGYNMFDRTIINASKLENLGWNPQYDIDHGISTTINILK